MSNPLHVANSSDGLTVKAYRGHGACLELRTTDFAVARLEENDVRSELIDGREKNGAQIFWRARKKVFDNAGLTLQNGAPSIVAGAPFDIFLVRRSPSAKAALSTLPGILTRRIRTSAAATSAEPFQYSSHKTPVDNPERNKRMKRILLFSLLPVIFLWPGGCPVATAQEPAPSWALSDEITFEGGEQIQGFSTKGEFAPVADSWGILPIGERFRSLPEGYGSVYCTINCGSLPALSLEYH